MKENKIVFLVIFLFLIFYPSNVKAYLNSVTDSNKVIHKDEVNNGTYLLMCSYVHKDGFGIGNRFERINIYYAYDANWVISWDNTNSRYNYSHDKIGSHNHIFSTKKTNIYISDSDKYNLTQKGICPEFAWLNISAVGKSVERQAVCFGNRAHCEKETLKPGGLFSVSFIGNNTSEKNYDYNDDMDTYFRNYNLGINDCNAFRKKEINIEEKINTDFIKKFLKVNDNKGVPDFIQNNSQYKAGIDKIKNQQVKGIKAKCDLEVHADSSLSSEQKKELLEQNTNAYNDLLDQIQNIEDQITVDRDITIPVGKTTCKVLFKGNFGLMLKQIFNLVRFAVPLLIIGLGVVDYIKGIASQNQDEIKKITTKMGKRLAIGVVIFLLPTLLQLILGLAGFGISDCFDWMK